eukprot:scaffold195707_cov30-Tisochrysis_lutea.AAC.2
MADSMLVERVAIVSASKQATTIDLTGADAPSSSSTSAVSHKRKSATALGTAGIEGPIPRKRRNVLDMMRKV